MGLTGRSLRGGDLSGVVSARIELVEERLRRLGLIVWLEPVHDVRLKVSCWHEGFWMDRDELGDCR